MCRKAFSLSVILLGLLFISGISVHAENARRVKIMSYNIRNSLGLDDVRNYDRTAKAILACAPEVVAVQEVDSATQRSGGRYVLGELAWRTGMHPLFAAAISYDGGKYGIGILSRNKPLGYHVVPLPGREEKRALLVAEFEDYVLGCAHLSLTPEDRMASLAILQRESGAAGKPFFLAGDFNAHPDDPFIKGLGRQFTLLTDEKKATYPADKPDEVIDYIFLSNSHKEDVLPLSKAVREEPVASDHRPVCVDLYLKKPVDRIFRMKPYLQNPVHNGITVMWHTTVPTYSWVEYGTDKEHLQQARTIVDGQVICNGLQNKIRLENLEKGKTYYYRVCSKEILHYGAYSKQFGRTAVSDFYTFRLPEDHETDFTALIFNDVHQHAETLRALYAQVKDLPCDFVVFNGDIIDDPASYDQAASFLKIMMETVGAERIPAFMVRGNHEIRNAYSIGLRSLFDYVDDKVYNAFNWGDTRFVTLDCGEDKPDSTWVYYGLNDFSGLRQEQTAFLSHELKGKAFRKASRRVLIHHIPVYGLNSAYNPCGEAWGKWLEKAPFDVCLNAHTHRYAYHPAGSLGNRFPVIIGGGPQLEKATVMVLQKKQDKLTLKVLNAKGNVLLKLEL